MAEKNEKIDRCDFPAHDCTLQEKNNSPKILFFHQTLKQMAVSIKNDSTFKDPEILLPW